MAKSFADLGLSAPTLKALADVGYESPSPIQEEAIPSLLAGRDVIGQAQTGTGKTAAFGLPIMEYIDPSESTVQALVLTPTRERLDRCLGGVDVLHDRQAEGRRLAGAGLGLADHVAALQQRRDRLLLDRARRLVADVGERLERRGRKAEICE